MKRQWIAWAGAAAVAGSAYLSAQTGPSGGAPCAPAALVTYEQGRVAAVDWVDYGAGRVHTKVIETRSHIVDATIDLRADGTAARSKVDVTTAGEEQRMGGMDMSQPRDLGAGAIYWSPRIPSSIEQAILRARSLGQPAVTIPGASLYSSSRYDVAVEKVDPTSWVVRALDREYDVVTDERGCVQSVTLPAYGVTIERRTDVPQAPYPLWTPYGPPPDHAYTSTDEIGRAHV